METISGRKNDVIIVGAGPSGSSAAYLLAASGMKVTLIDKCSFPRIKLCGGLLTGRSEKIFHDIFETSWDPVIETTSYGATLFKKYECLNSFENYRPIHFTSRDIFDRFLLELARGKGAQILQGTRVVSVDQSENSITFTDGKKMFADFIIGADGVMSSVANSLFHHSRKLNNLAVCLETEVPRDQINEQLINPEVYLDIVRWGYGWVFPKKRSLTVGVGGIKKYNPDIKNTLSDLLKHRFGEKPKCQIKAHYLPFGRYLSTPGSKNILLVGDAAGLVEPITGEGIAFAMESGKLAAESVIKAANNNKPDSACIEYKIKYNRLTKILRQANFIKYLFFSKPAAPLFHNIMKNNFAILRFIDIMAGDMNYKEYLNILLKNIPKNIFPLKQGCN
jgi:menaquinone-9 beta-reductase